MADARLITPGSHEERAHVLALRVSAAPEYVDAELHDEAVILHLPSRRFHGLDPVGTRIWQLLKTPSTIAQLRDAVVAEYEVTPERCEADLLVLLQELDGAGLLEVHGASS